MSRPSSFQSARRETAEERVARRHEAEYLAARLRRLGQMMEYRAHDHGDMRTLPLAAELFSLSRSVERRWLGRVA